MAVGEHEVGRENGQGEGEQEADPDENRVGLDHAAVSNHRANESAHRSVRKQQIMTREDTGDGSVPEERDDGDDGENNTSDNDANSCTRGDFDLGVVQEVGSRVDG